MVLQGVRQGRGMASFAKEPMPRIPLQCAST